MSSGHVNLVVFVFGRVLAPSAVSEPCRAASVHACAHSERHVPATHKVMDIDCMLHQYQLMVQSSLSQVDKFGETVFVLGFKYFSTLCKIMHSWRDKATTLVETTYRLST